MKSLGALGVVPYLLLAPALALASTSYPPEIEEHYGISSLPVPGQGCTLCHSNDVGGVGTIRTPYGRAMLNRYGVGGANLPSLRSGLDQADAAGQDSDGDGISDADELLEGTDPNLVPSTPGMPEVPPSSVDDVPLPQTGCSLRAAPGDTASALAALVAMLLVVSRRRRA